MTPSRIFLILLISFIAGVAVRSFIAVPIVAVLAGLLIAAAAAAFGIRTRHAASLIAGICLCTFFGGVIRFSYAAEIRPDLSKFLGKELLMRGIVWKDPERADNSQRIRLKVTEVEGRILDEFFYALVTARRYPSYTIGDALKIHGVLEAPSNYSEFDYVSYLARDRIFSVIAFPEMTKVGEGEGPRLPGYLAAVKRAFEEKIDGALPEPHAAFLKGLTLGERESLPPELVEDFRRTGTSHIVALSGYNITLVGRFLMLALLAFTVPFRISFWIAAGGIILFVMLTGGSASVVRAGIMGVLMLVAEREGRMYQMTNALIFAAGAMIFHNPYILRFDAAFGLSFLATAGLIYFPPRIEAWYGRIRSYLHPIFRNDIRDTLLSFEKILIETLSAQLAVMPLLIYFFGRVSVISPVTNVLVLIAVPYAMIAGFITGSAGFLCEPCAVFAGWATWIFLDYMLRVIGLFARLPGASIEASVWIYVPLLCLYGWLLARFLRNRSTA